LTPRVQNKLMSTNSIS